MNELVLPQHRISFIDLNSLLPDIADLIIIDLKQYGEISTIGSYKINRNIKRIFYYHTIKGICDYTLSLKTSNKIIYYFNDNCIHTNLSAYFISFDIQDMFEKIIKVLVNNTPLKILDNYNLNFKDLYHLSTQDREDIFKDILYDAKLLIQNTTNPSFSRIKTFAKRNKLTFLTEEYFNDLKVGQLMFA